MYVLENWSNWLRLYASQGSIRHIGGCSRLNANGAYPQGQSNVRTMGCCGRKKLLMIMTSVCACASFAFLCIAVATDYWLYCEEKTEVFPNGTYHTKRTITGLWRKCVEMGRLCCNNSSKCCVYGRWCYVFVISIQNESHEKCSHSCNYMHMNERVVPILVGPNSHERLWISDDSF